jgi:hypothetical protein
MSLAYNMINTLNSASKMIVHPASLIIESFYINNSNPKEEEIKEFADKNKINPEEVNLCF